MLIELRFKNFLSFRDEQVLSMVASADKTLSAENTVLPANLGKRRLVRSAVVYGANASGKTNLMAVFSFLGMFVEKSAVQEPGAPILVAPFRLDGNSANAPSEFELTFIHDSVRYQYGFVVDQARVHQEWLLAYPKGSPQRWFERSWDPDAGEYQWYFGSQLKGEKAKLTNMTRDNVLFLSAAAQFNHQQLTSVHKWFARYLRSIDVDRDSLVGFTAGQAHEDEASKQAIVQLLQSSDIDIEDLSFNVIDRHSITDDHPQELRRLISERGDDVQYINILVHHRTTGFASGQVKFPLEVESNGTQRMFALGGPLLETLDQGYVLAVDELDSSLHPLLVRRLIGMFHDSAINHKDAQLIFNTHDTTLLDPALFRRDQVWFVEKDDSGASHLYPLLEFSPRKTEALEKWYLAGRYGAIPVMSELKLSEAGSCYGED